jgi:DNA-binding transcriptional ArsR family regulator
MSSADRDDQGGRGSGPYVDAQLFSELDTGVYEAVATLEYLGSSITADEIREATGLDASAVGEILDALTEHGVLTRRRTDAGDAFELARRDWSATPQIRSH